MARGPLYFPVERSPLFGQANALKMKTFFIINARGRSRIARPTRGMCTGNAASSGERGSIREAFFFCYFSFGQAKEK
jgi:hypothetical protein